MQVSVDVTDEMRREAESRGLPVIDHIELLIEKGRSALSGGPLCRAQSRGFALCAVRKRLRGNNLKPTRSRRADPSVDAPVFALID